MPTTPPTLVAQYWQGSAGDRINGTLPKSISVTCAVGDRLLVWACMADNAATITTPTGGTAGLTWTSLIAVSGIANYAGVYAWGSNAVTTAGTFSLSITKTGGSGTFFWVPSVMRWSDCSGWGAATKTNVASGAPSLAITPQQENSSIVVVNADWNAVDGAGRAWRSGAGALTEVFYERDVTTSSTLTAYAGYHANSGLVAAKTVGLTSPSQKYSIIAVEAKGVTTTAAPPPRNRTHRSLLAR